MLYNEEKLIKWSKPISDSEDQRCLKAIDGVVDVMKSFGWKRDGSGLNYDMIIDSQQAYKTTLTSPKGCRVKVIIQGSYGSNTNVRKESDVDIAVILINTFRPIYRNGVSGHDYGFVSSDYGVLELKQELHEMLRRAHPDNVERRSKTIHVSESPSMVNSDVVPAIQQRDYREDYAINPQNYKAGIYIYDESKKKEISNYPEQHIENGIAKNKDTKKYYKKMVRIYKNIRYDMQKKDVDFASTISSFGIESLVYNIPDYVFLNKESYIERFQATLQFLINNIHENFVEANNIKALFPNQTKLNDYQNYIKTMNDFVGD